VSIPGTRDLAPTHFLGGQQMAKRKKMKAKKAKKKRKAKK
jgi:hypothetical protein